MSQSNVEIIEKGLLTIPINPNSNEFKDLKSLLDDKIKTLSKSQLELIELMSTRVKIKEYLKSNISRKQIVSSGKFLKELLGKLNVRQNRFAEYLEIRPSNLSKVLNGERKISFELSLILEQLFKIESHLWLEIQRKNKLIALSKRKIQSLKKYKLKDLTVNTK